MGGNYYLKELHTNEDICSVPQARKTRSNLEGIAGGQRRFDKGWVAIIF